jgi:cytochrome c-type biogenesis protein CcsB
MSKSKRLFSKFLLPLFSTKAAGFYLIVFAAAIGSATFIENDFGTSAAQKLVYQSTWFEVLLVLFCTTLIVNVIQFKFVQRHKWALLIFHLAMVVILIGAGITRYFGYEGVMHIRENSSSNVIYSSDTYLNYNAKYNGQNFRFNESVLFASVGDNEMDETYLVDDKKVKVVVKEVIPNPVQSMASDPSGKPTLKVVFGGETGREEYFLHPGDKEQLQGVKFNFTEEAIPGAINIRLADGKLSLQTDRDLVQMVMADRSIDTLAAFAQHPLKLRSLYNNGSQAFVFGEYLPAAKVEMHSGNEKIENSSTIAVLLSVAIGDQHFERYILGSKGNLGRPEIFSADGLSLSVTYGARVIELPFSLFLRDFSVERYPGTNSPASFASEVTLNDARKGLKEDYRIYMNHVLDHAGYRFFQSSYDRDELGSYLSVNYDVPGTIVTYIGYILLTLGLVMVFFSKNTRFHQLSQNIKKLRGAAVLLAFFLTGGLASSDLYSQQAVEAELEVVDANHAELVSRVVVQDFRGRMKPMHTLTRELMRKVSGSESYRNYNADQVILSMYANKSSWYAVPLIAIGKDNGVAELLGIKNGDKAAYRDFFSLTGKYKLADGVRESNNTKPAERGIFEKQLIKVDERLNVVNMIFSGSFFRVIPIENDHNNTWVSERTHGQQQQNRTVADRFFDEYHGALHEAMHEGNYTYPNQIISELKKYQETFGGAVIPSTTKLETEILLNESKVFNRLALYYFSLGLLFLVLLFYTVFRPTSTIGRLQTVFLTLVAIGFVAHSAGLGLRWYVSGRAPWSNGYESMIYIAWTATLAGLLFTRRSLGGMAATLVLSGTVLLIALLSYLDPEITPLVPVLRSYWLTIHVSLEAGSYGFLMLGAIIGLINLMLYAVMRKTSKKRILRIIKEMSFISEMTLIGGIVMLSVGTYLGGVWANESWGRYWGWDAKETWALVSILVYAFILHMRLIPGLKSLFAYNFATLFGLSSVIMTYFGVNYYLSGLHSYAAGDPVPIPDWVYIAVSIVAAISAFAYWRKRAVGV